MADITKCQDHYCEQRDTCYRYLATPSPTRQAYFAESPRISDYCPQYWDVSPVHITGGDHRIIIHEPVAKYWTPERLKLDGRKPSE